MTSKVLVFILILPYFKIQYGFHLVLVPIYAYYSVPHQSLLAFSSSSTNYAFRLSTKIGDSIMVNRETYVCKDGFLPNEKNDTCVWVGCVAANHQRQVDDKCECTDGTF